MRIAWPYIKSMEPLDGGRMLIETPSGFKIESESQMDGKATIIPPGIGWQVLRVLLRSADTREIEGCVLL